jgi:hypothetical protein
MTAKEAEDNHIWPSQARCYFRLNAAKMNYSTADDDEWFHLRSVSLGNPTQHYPSGDSVGVVECFIPPARPTPTLNPTAPPTTSNPALDRTALGVIAAAPADELLTTSKRGGTTRNVHERVKKAARLAGITMHRKDADTIIEQNINDLAARQLIAEHKFTDKHRNSKFGLKLTEEGYKLLKTLGP